MTHPSRRVQRVLIATHNYPRWAGDPAGAFVALLARALVDDGMDVRVLAPHAAGLATEAVESGVSVRRFRYAPERWELAAYGTTGQRVGARRVAALASVPAFLGAYRRAVRAEARAWQPDVVHAHWWMPGAVVSAGWGGALVVTCHGTDVQLLGRSAASRAVARRLVPAVTRWTTVSQFLADELAAGIGQDRLAGHVAVTPMPVDVPDTVVRDGDGPRNGPAAPGELPRVLYAGNLLLSKGIDVLIEAVAQLRTHGVDVALRVVGQGPARAALEQLTRNLGMTDRVDWAGPLPHSTMPDEFAAAAMTVLPSRAGAEGLGLVLVEALLHGCPVVGTDAGGIPETVIPDVTGLLARAGDVDDLARQIARYVADPALARRLTAAGRVRAYDRHAPARCATRFRALYQHALDDHAPADARPAAPQPARPSAVSADAV